ncbi:MAG: aldolase/citrate lyase family protein [Myxococcota bacterium]
MGKRGQAGRPGADVRSDCHVVCELRDQGGIEIELQSKVESMFGTQIRTQVEGVLAEIGAAHAHVSVQDGGALPFTIAARVEAAVRDADPSLQRCSLPEPVQGWDQPTRRDRFRRSRLYLPGNEPKFMINAGLYGADGLILDLEDSVAPSHKLGARYLVRNALRAVDFGGAERMVRINQGQLGLEDIDAIIQQNVHVVLIPKVESAEQVKDVEGRIINHLGPDHGVLLMPIIESAKGGWFAYDVATASEAVVALAIGLEDYTADIGTQRTNEGRESLWLRQQVVNAARAAGVQPIDTVFSDVADSEGLRASVVEAKSLGFDGKGCIHPRQIGIIHEAFAPSKTEVDKAVRIVRAFDRAQEQGLAAVSLGSKMIDPPVVKRALTTVTMAVACKVLPPDWKDEEVSS